MSKFKTVMLSIGMVVAMLIAIACTAIVATDVKAQIDAPLLTYCFGFICLMIAVFTVNSVVRHLGKKFNRPSRFDRLVLLADILMCLTCFIGTWIKGWHLFAIVGSALAITCLAALISLIKYIDSLQVDLAKQEDTCVNQLKTIEELQTAKANVEKELGNANGTNYKLRNDVDTMQTQLHEANDAKATAEQERDNAIEDRKKAEVEYAKLKKANEELQQKLDNNQASNDLVKKNDELVRENTDLKTKLKSIEDAREAHLRSRRERYAKNKASKKS